MATALSSPPVNFAKQFGFNSVPAAIAFAVLYAPLLVLFICKAFKRPGHVYIIMVIFCNIRLGAFVMRAFLAGNASAGQILGLLIADEVLLGVGYAGLLYSVYTLVLDRHLTHSKFSTTPAPAHPLFRLLHHLLQNRLFIRLVLTVGVTLGVMASTRINNPAHGTDSTTKTMKRVGVIIQLVLTALMALQALRLLHVELATMPFAGYEPQLPVASTDTVSMPMPMPTYASAASSDLESHTNTNTKSKPPQRSFAQTHAARILCIVAGLLLTREIFSTATLSDAARQNDERVWYPFVALPELLAVVLVAAPGLVPRREDLPKATQTGFVARLFK